MDTSKIIKGVVNSGRYTVTAPIVKEDYGLYLQIEGVELPQTYEVDFSNSEQNGTSVTMIGNSDGVLIPHQFIDTGKDIFAFLYHVGEDYGRTVYKFRIPNKVRPDRTEDTPTPEEQSVIDQVISALNEAVEQTSADVASADASARSAQGYAEQAETAKTNAQTYANNAQTSATQASASASQASASASASANSASASAQIKADVEELVDDAQGYAESASQSATASANSATTAQGYAQSASSSSQSASDYASQAQTSAQTASTKANEASASASTASTKATEASQSAENALSYKTDAESAKTASQTAQGLAESARDTAVSAKTDAESARDDAVQAKTDVQNIADGIDTRLVDVESALIDKAPIITDTASGSIASFSDGADDLPLKSLVVDINPIQDLHGQDAPYPAGGGKNKAFIRDASFMNNGVSAVCSASAETVTLKGTAVSSGGRNSKLTGVITLSAGSYVMSATAISGTKQATYIVNNAETNAYISGNTFTLSEETTVFIGANVTNGTAYDEVVRLQIEEGSTATAWSPYENICPISGWTSVDVEQSGINVWDEEWELGYWNYVTGNHGASNFECRSKNPIPVCPNTTYYFKRGSDGVRGDVLFYDANDNYIGYVTANGNKTFITPSDCSYIKFNFGNDYGTTYNHDISINYPSTDHSYHPYTGRSIPINLGQTVYGGKLDVLSGVMRVDMANIASYNGETLPSTWISDRDVYASGTTPTTGAQVVYQLATPLEIQLTPNQVNSLLGVNNIWADSGDTTAEYRADTKLYIAKKIAEAISALS